MAAEGLSVQWVRIESLSHWVRMQSGTRTLSCLYVSGLLDLFTLALCDNTIHMDVAALVSETLFSLPVRHFKLAS